jgi:hypothetical protein
MVTFALLAGMAALWSMVFLLYRIVDVLVVHKNRQQDIATHLNLIHTVLAGHYYNELNKTTNKASDLTS